MFYSQLLEYMCILVVFRSVIVCYIPCGMWCEVIAVLYKHNITSSDTHFILYHLQNLCKWICVSQEIVNSCLYNIQHVLIEEMCQDKCVLYHKSVYRNNWNRIEMWTVLMSSYDNPFLPRTITWVSIVPRWTIRCSFFLWNTWNSITLNGRSV